MRIQSYQQFQYFAFCSYNNNNNNTKLIKLHNAIMRLRSQFSSAAYYCVILNMINILTNNGIHATVFALISSDI